MATHRGTPGDIEFYQRVCAGAASVLELGCAGGRILEKLSEVTANAVGIEANEDFCRSAETACAAIAHVRIIRADMRAFALERCFDRVVIPYNGIYCLLSEQDVVRCLACAAQHLSADGLLVFDAYAVDVFHDHPELDDTPDDAWEQVATVHLRGQEHEVLERSTWDRDNQRVHAYYAYRQPGTAPEREHRISHRYLLSTQVAPLLEAAGLELVVLHGDFDQSAFEPGSPRLIVTAAHRSTTTS